MSLLYKQMNYYIHLISDLDKDILNSMLLDQAILYLIRHYHIRPEDAYEVALVLIKPSINVEV